MIAQDPQRARWHTLFHLAMRGTLTPAEQTELSGLLKQNSSARQLWYVVCDNEVALGEQGEHASPPAALPRVPPAGRRSLRLPALAAAMTLLAFALGALTALHFLPITPAAQDQEVAQAAEAESEAARLTTTESLVESRRPNTGDSVIQEALLESEEVLPVEESSRPPRPESRRQQADSMTSEAKAAGRPESLLKLEAEVAPRGRVAAFAEHGDRLYLIADETLYVRTRGDGLKRLGDHTWPDVTAMAAGPRRLIVVGAASLYVVELPGGVRKRLGDATFPYASSVTLRNNVVHVLVGGTLHRLALPSQTIPIQE